MNEFIETSEKIVRWVRAFPHARLCQGHRNRDGGFFGMAKRRVNGEG